MGPTKILSAFQIPTLGALYLAKEIVPDPEPITAPSTTINSQISLHTGDITNLSVDAIVNAANSSLLGGGGVDGAIHRGAGPSLLAECRTLGGCKTGQAKITKGHKLHAKHVIHTVGPVFRTKQESEPLLRSCYETSLKVAVDNEVKTVAFSAVSTGVYGYPSKEAARVACEAVRGFLESAEGQKIDQVIFVTFEMKDVDAYNEMIP